MAATATISALLRLRLLMLRLLPPLPPSSPLQGGATMAGNSMTDMRGAKAVEWK